MPAPAPDTTRLHISPFDADLLSLVIPASILPNARNISYHTIETLPDKRFGFVDLPDDDAARVRKRLNGTVLKGVKMRVEKARPEAAHPPAEDPDAAVTKDKKRKKQRTDDGADDKKKRKKDHALVEGVALPEGRKVKRGWTVTDEDKIKEKRKSKKERDDDAKDKKDKKKKKREERSKYTDREECLLKTKLPGGGGSATAEADEADGKKRKKSKRETVIHEFANTTKFPSFLRANKASTTDSSGTEFVEGKGWVDAEGNVVEAVKPKKSAPKKKPAPPPKEPDTSSDESSEDEAPAPVKAAPAKKTVAVVEPPVDDTTSSSGGSSDDESDSGRGTAEPPNTALATPAKSILKAAPPPAADDDDTSSSGSSADDSEADSDKEDDTAVLKSPLDALKDDSRPKSSSSNVSLTIKIPPPPPMTPGKVHPLEALYKRNKDAAAAAEGDDAEAQPFSFFGGGGDNDDIEEEDPAAGGLQVPMTPFSQRDFEWRNVRSAAPTPDTAHPSRTKIFWEGGDDDAAEDNDADMADAAAEEYGPSEANGEATAGPAGDFQKWFWENRRNLNQSWMKRRKTVAKEKRHRDNKSRAAKVV